MKKTILLLSMTTLAITATMAQVKKNDDEAIRILITTLEKGWNAKSGEIFASAFADTHDYIVVNGFYFSNLSRQGNAFAHQSLFDGIYKNRDLTVKVDKIQYIRQDLVQITALAATYLKDSIPVDPTAIMTILAEKKKDDWKIISFHNHSLSESFAAKTPPVPYKVMYASWYKN
ncbi:MAG: SgcJ/EcaC family oxidoreductase [Chitinophagaceae bacterium]